jgi:hypothetical protein
MEKKSEKKPDVHSLKKQLETAAGREIDVAAEQIVNFRWPVSAYSYADGEVLWRNIFFPGKNCAESTLLDVSASSSTGADGTVTFLLSSYYCDALYLFAPVNLQATVRGTTPAFLTMAYSLVSQPPDSPYSTDLQVTVYAWDAAGKAAPNVNFDWRCRVVSSPIIE